MRTAEGSPIPGAISIARVLCILGIVYVHGWTGLTAEKFEPLARTAQGIERWVLIELVGRCAVPLLGAVSGWLSGPSAARRGYRPFMANKLRTLLLPLVLWNAIAIAAVSSAAHARLLQAPIPRDLWETLDWLTCLTQPSPINVQISFLRDLFVCMAFAPLLARARPWVTWAVLAVAVLWSFTQPALHAWLSPPIIDRTAWDGDAHAPHGPFGWVADAIVGHLLLRPPILVFFASGLLARRYGWAERIAGWPVWACLVPYLLLAPAKAWLSITNEAWERAHPGLVNGIDLPMRFAAAVAIWRLALLLAPTRAGAAIGRGERYIFLLFCAHLVMLWLGGPLLGRLTGPMGSPLWSVYFLLQPAIVFAATLPIAWALEAGSRPLAGWLSGGRLAQPRASDLPASAGSAKEPASPAAGASPP